MGAINLYIEKRGKFAVASQDSRNRFSPLPPLYLKDSQAFNVVALDPTGTDIEPFYTVPDLSASGLRVSITDGEDVLAGPGVFVWNAVDEKFEGRVALNTAELIAAYDLQSEEDDFDVDVGALFKIEISTTDADGRTHILTEDIRIKKVADVDGAPEPLVIDEYPTRTEVDNAYVQKRHVGEIILVGDDGTEVTLKCVNGVLETNPANS